MTENVCTPVVDSGSAECHVVDGSSTVLTSRNVVGLSVSGYDMYEYASESGVCVTVETECNCAASDALYSNDERPDDARCSSICFPAVSYLNLCVARGYYCNSIDC